MQHNFIRLTNQNGGDLLCEEKKVWNARENLAPTVAVCHARQSPDEHAAAIAGDDNQSICF